MLDDKDQFTNHDLISAIDYTAVILPWKQEAWPNWYSFVYVPFLKKDSKRVLVAFYALYTLLFFHFITLWCPLTFQLVKGEEVMNGVKVHHLWWKKSKRVVQKRQQNSGYSQGETWEQKEWWYFVTEWGLGFPLCWVLLVILFSASQECNRVRKCAENGNCNA